jgi:EpsG family
MKYSTISLIIAGYLLALFSPIISLFWCSIALLISQQNKYSLILYRPILAIVLALTVAGQTVGSFESDDFENYFNVYVILSKGGSLNEAAVFLGNPLELALPFSLYLISLIFNELNPTQLKLIISLVFSIAAIEVILRAEANKEASARAALLITFISLVSLSLFSQLVRQGFSTILIFAATVVASRWLKFALATAAVLFHTTALPIIIVIYLLSKRPYTTILIVSMLAVAFFYIHPLLNALGADEISKLAFVARQEFSSALTATEKGNLKTLLIAFLIVLFAVMLRPKVMLLDDLKQHRNYFILFSLLFIIFLPVPLLSSRITMFFTLFLIGYCVGQFLLPLDKKIQIPIIASLSLIKPIMYLDFSLSKTDYWGSYPAISIMPGYFIEAFL